MRLMDTSLIVYIPEGPFLMGTDDASRPERERPLHEVMLSGYWIDQTEVTNAQYRQCVDAGTCPFPTNTRNYDDPRYSSFPVAYVTWEAASGYCDYVGRAMGLDVRLPTEAQWEKAASWDPFALTKRTYPWGEEFPNRDLMRYIESITVFQGAEVGTHPAGASAYGALDMAGNMAEFVFDRSSEDYYSQPEATFDPQGPAEGGGRVIRGGSWAQSASFAVTTRRILVETETNGEEIGFRCATNATTITPDNNVAFTPQEVLGGAQAAVALALAEGAGDITTLNEWQAALISMDAQLESGSYAEVLLEIDRRLQTLEPLVQAETIPEGTALKLRNTLQWIKDQLEVAAETTEPIAEPAEPAPPTPEAPATPEFLAPEQVPPEVEAVG
jgi:formylglycine-generating enzyme required for sulfatase activity